jgi:DNA polymerase
MKPHGRFEKEILFVGEAPGATEDENGKQWQGRMGHVLEDALAKLGVDLFEDCASINSINCRPTNSEGNNRAPTDKEISYCRPLVFNAIKGYKPKVVILLGGCAVTSLIGARWTKDIGTVSKWRGWTIPDREFGCWICTTFHPSYIERSSKQPEIATIWKSDLKAALSMVDKPFSKFKDESTQIEIITDLNRLEALGDPIAFDYETTGLKPHDTTKHFIPCMSVSDGAKTFAFMLPGDSIGLAKVRRMLKSKRGKIASNIKFEDTWSFNILGYRPNNWIWDTMLASHVLDNRPGICGLKFQSFVRFGVLGYDDEVSPFLKATDNKNGNAVNRITDLIKTEAGRRKLLIYCGIDSLLEYRLAMAQMKEMRI